MKILIINKHLFDSLGGSELQCHLIADELSTRGHQVVYGATSFSRGEKYISVNYEVVDLKFPVIQYFGKLLDELNPDVIYWRFNKNEFFPYSKKAFEKKVKLIFAVSAVEDTQPFSFRPVRRYTAFQLPALIKNAISQKLYSFRNYRGFKYVSYATVLSKKLLNKLPVEKQIVVYNSVPLEAVEFSWNKPFIVWVSNIKKQKNPERYLALVKKLAVVHPAIDFLMVGELQDKTYEQSIRETEAFSNFRYLGKKSPQEVNGILQKSLFLTHTCSPEGFGNIFIQSWFSARPTVSLYFDPDSIITAHSLGFFARGSFDEYCENVQKLILNTELREQMGANARHFATANFTTAAMVDKVENVMKQIVEN